MVRSGKKIEVEAWDLTTMREGMMRKIN